MRCVGEKGLRLVCEGMRWLVEGRKREERSVAESTDRDWVKVDAIRVER